MIPESKWRWFGHAGHLVVGNDCRFHLWTKIGGYIISTVGDYRPKHKNGDGDMEPIGAGKDSFFETYVFAAGKNDMCGCPYPKYWGEIDGVRYATHEAANAGHVAYCRKYAKKRPRKAK